MPSSAFVRQWLLLTAVLLILGGTIGWDLYTDYTTTDLQERGRLVTQAKVVDKNLEHQLTATNHALDSIRRDILAMKAEKDGLSSLNRRLEAIRGAMPTTRAVTIFDANGTLIARSPNQFVGENFKDREYFQAALRGGNREKLYVAPPFLAKTGEYVLNMSKTLLDDRGRFAGVILVSLGPEYFDTLLKSVLYEPDMRSTLIHGDGKIIFRAPDPQGLTGIDLSARPGSFFLQHLKSGQPISIFAGTGGSAGEARLTVFLTIRPAAVPMDKPLVVTVSRELPALFASWHESVTVRGGLFLLLTLATTIGLFLYQRRQLADARLLVAQETKRRQAEEALHLQTFRLEQEVSERQIAQDRLQEKALLLEEEIEKRQKMQDELELSNERLEQRVQKRTAELEAKNSELERLNKIFVGRELKMIELKERIRALENDLGI